MKNYTTVLKGYRFVMLIIAFMNFLIFANILPSNLFAVLLILAIIASCSLSFYIKKNRSNITSSINNDRKTDAFITIIWLISLFITFIK